MNISVKVVVEFYVEFLSFTISMSTLGSRSRSHRRETPVRS